MPHGFCYQWDPGLIALHVISDAIIALAYYSIPLTLVYLVRRKDLAFDWIFLCFAAFIVACGTTHVMEIYNIWHPTYWLSGIIKLFTAIVSIVTAILLVQLVPRVLALPSPEELRLSNEALQREVKERTSVANEVVALNATLNAKSVQLEGANKELEAFAYSVSHDLRAPLRHIDGYVDMLKSEAKLDASCARYAEVISESAHKMGSLIDNLLAFSRMGRAALKMTPVAMEQLVIEARETLDQDTKGREIEWKIGPLPTVIGDRSLLLLVWENLIGNAIKYSRQKEKATIAIAYRETPDDYEFSVQDNGAGFDMKYVDKLFGIFQRLHFKEEFEGNGIGLANVRRIIARHGGRTWAEAEVGQGATFFFSLPRSGRI